MKINVYFYPRIRKKFLFFPKCIGGITRWFEMATWEEEFQPDYCDWYWKSTRWLDKYNDNDKDDGKYLF